MFRIDSDKHKRSNLVQHARIDQDLPIQGGIMDDNTQRPLSEEESAFKAAVPHPSSIEVTALEQRWAPLMFFCLSGIACLFQRSAPSS